MTIPERSPKNVALFILALALMAGGIFYGIFEAQENARIKKEQFQKMTLQELGEYITEKNPGTQFYVFTLQIGMYLSPDEIQVMEHDKTNILHTKKVKTLAEDCQNPLFRTYLEKGGAIEYSFYNKETRMIIFQLTNLIKDCLDAPAL